MRTFTTEVKHPLIMMTRKTNCSSLLSALGHVSRTNDCFDEDNFDQFLLCAKSAIIYWSLLT